LPAVSWIAFIGQVEGNMTFSQPRAQEFRDAVKAEIYSALKSGANIAEIFAVLGFLFQESIEAMETSEERAFAVRQSIKMLKTIDRDSTE
jgi:hypothetical protein